MRHATEAPATVTQTAWSCAAAMSEFQLTDAVCMERNKPVRKRKSKKERDQANERKQSTGGNRKKVRENKNYLDGLTERLYSLLERCDI